MATFVRAPGRIVRSTGSERARESDWGHAGRAGVAHSKRTKASSDDVCRKDRPEASEERQGAGEVVAFVWTCEERAPAGPQRGLEARLGGGDTMGWDEEPV